MSLSLPDEAKGWIDNHEFATIATIEPDGRPHLSVVWIGYDNPRKLGDRETGGGLALPVWIEYMAHALRNLPLQLPDVPEGLMQQGGDWVFDEFGGGAGISSVGLEDKLPVVPTEGERKSILDLFR